MKAIKRYQKAAKSLMEFEWLPLVAMRLTLAYGFLEPALMKWKNMDGIGQWFASMNYPFPVFNAYAAAITEAFGVVLLALGLGTRIISIPLIVVMLVAILTVHYDNGFAAGDNGFEIPFYYLIMLLLLFVKGGGAVSIDHLISKFRR